jgi:hypothetical protein
MGLDKGTASLIGALAVTGVGLYSLLKGELTYGPENGSSEDDRLLVGGKARIVSVVLIAAGIALFFSTTVGLCLLIAAVLLPWLLGE